MRRRGEFLERSFAHAYETGGLRRVYLRVRENVYKRVLIHVSALNLSLVMRQWLGKGTPRGWQGFSADALLSGLQLWIEILMALAFLKTTGLRKLEFCASVMATQATPRRAGLLMASPRSATRC